MSKAVCCNLAKQFAALKQNCNDDLCQASLIDDNIDQWEVHYIYPEHKAKVKLIFQFSLTEDLPPKVIVLEPKEVEYICFQEFGARDWRNSSTLATLVLALRFALAERYTLNTNCFSYLNCRYTLNNSSGSQTRENAEKQWEFVKEAHSEWQMPDITALNSKVSNSEAQVARKEAKQVLSNADIITSCSNNSKSQKNHCIIC